jgi:hypothetical protein
MKKLSVGDRIRIWGGYGNDPLFMKNPPNKERIGKVIKTIPGQNKEVALVVKLDFPITGNRVTGDILILELRYEEQTWATDGPVHLELCDFYPEEKPWNDRKQGEWIESHASFDIIEYG